MYRVDPTEVGWMAHHRRFVMRRSCEGGMAYVLRSADIRQPASRRRTIGQILAVPYSAATSRPPASSIQATTRISPTHLPGGDHGLFSKRVEQEGLVAAVGEPRAN